MSEFKKKNYLPCPIVICKKYPPQNQMNKSTPPHHQNCCPSPFKLRTIIPLVIDKLCGFSPMSNRARDIAPRSIRALYGISDTRNVTHGSGKILITKKHKFA